MYNTDIKMKKENWPKFEELVRNQWEFGGTKYELSPGKEVTDLICEAFPGITGIDFILSNIMKYTMRYKNLGRERDLLKIATYCFLAWLKAGFFLKKEHDEDAKKN